jgi:hypothetical protein
LKYYPLKAGLTPRNKCEQVGLQQDWQKLAGRQETKMMQESEIGLRGERSNAEQEVNKVDRHSNLNPKRDVPFLLNIHFEVVP